MIHPIAFFSQNEEGELFTTGVIFQKNINKSIKDHINKKPKTPQNSNPFKNFESNAGESPIKSEIVTKKTNYRVKIVEIEMNSNGIFVNAIKIKDKSIKDPFIVKEELKKLLDKANEIRKMEFSGKPQLYDDKISEKLKDVDIKFDSVDDMDEILYNIAAIFFKTEFFINPKPNIIFQELLETKDILKRISFVSSKLDELKVNFEYQIKISNIVSADKVQQKIFDKNKNLIASDYVKTIFGIADQNFTSAGQFGNYPGANNKFVKGYLEKLSLIKDPVSQEKIRKEIERLSALDRNSPEHSKLLTYLDEVFSIPWNKSTEPYWNIQQTKETLEKVFMGYKKSRKELLK